MGRGALADPTLNYGSLNACEQAGIAAEQAGGLPTGLLLAIGKVESGRWDPGKSHLQIDGTVYGRFQTKRGRAPHCALCEGGDMISIEERFIDSIYRPQ